MRNKILKYMFTVCFCNKKKKTKGTCIILHSEVIDKRHNGLIMDTFI